MLGIFFYEYYELSEAKRNKMEQDIILKKLFLETNDYDVCSENEELSSTTKKW